MAKCKQTAQEFIKNAFNPEVAVLCSPTIDKICQKNNLTFIELLQPFCKLTTDIQYKDPSGAIVTIRDLKVSVADVNSEPPPPYHARKYLNAAVSESRDSQSVVRTIGDFTLHVPHSTPWFDTWRDTFLQMQFPSDHEFCKHILACMLVVSSSDEQPVTAMNQVVDSLNQIQIGSSKKTPKWFNSNILRYYVVLHDVGDGNENLAHSTMESLRITYGANNCFLLKINSRVDGRNDDPLPDPWSQFICNRIDTSPHKLNTVKNSPVLFHSGLEVAEEISENTSNNVSSHPLSPVIEDNSMTDSFIETERERKATLRHTYHGSCLSTRDIEEIKLLILEFCTRALIPYMERQVQTISEVVSNKKGVGRTFLFNTKRWFSSAKPGGPTGVINSPMYASDSHELQMRRLGDLYFLFGHYSMAFQAYHSVKRDFEADQAWMHFAGALEMASLSAYMANMTTQKTLDYMEESIAVYLNTCKSLQFATRATLFSSECLKQNQLFGEAAQQLIRMTSEESDLQSALLLEEAAYCFLNSRMVRKYAFHMVLAGHRYSKAAQRKHSLRCYKQANEVYFDKGWILAEDHINYTIGRQANNLHLYEEAVQSFARLLSERSKQSAQQQSLFLKEYVTIYDHLMKNGKTSPLTVPLPIIDHKDLRFVTGPAGPLLSPGKIPATGFNLTKLDTKAATARWHKLEEMLLQEALGSLPMIYKPTVSLYTFENFTTATAIIHEPIQVYIKLNNPLQIVLNLRNVFLLWQFDDGSIAVSNETENESAAKYVKTYLTKLVSIPTKGQYDLVLTVTPLSVGTMTLIGICFDLLSNLQQEDPLGITGKLPFDPKVNWVLKVLPVAPALQVLFSEICSDVLCGEMQKVTVYLQNVGPKTLHKVYLASSVPELLSFVEFSEDISRRTRPQFTDNPSQRDKLFRKNHVTVVPLPNSRLEPNESHSIDIWLKAPYEKGATEVDLLIYYENLDPKSTPQYRLIRHSWNLQVQESITFDVLQIEDNLQFTITNVNKVHHTVLTEISLKKAGLYSPNLQLLNKIYSPSDLNLHSQETIHCCFSTKRCSTVDPYYSDVSFQPNTKQYKSAYLDFIKRFSYQKYINAFQDLQQPPENEPALAAVYWEALVIVGDKHRTADGLSIIPTTDEVNHPEEVDHGGFCEDNRVDNNLTVKTIHGEENQGCQIGFEMVHTPVVCHNFSTDKLCMVPLVLKLRNFNKSQTLAVHVKASDSLDVPVYTSKGSLFHEYPLKEFRWLGMADVLEVLEPFSSKSMDMTIVVMMAGTYDVGERIQVSVYKIGEPENAVIQRCRIESALIVVDSS